MFKKLLSGLTKFFTKERIIILIVFLILAWALYNYAGSKSMVLDRMSDGTGAVAHTPESSVPVSGNTVPSAATSGAASLSAPNGYSQKSVANPSELLPNDVNSQWASLNPNSMNQGDVLNPDLLQAGYHIGLDTIGQSLRNANLQLRSDPPIPKMDTGIWNQSTIEHDIGRVSMEIGSGTR